MRSAARARDGYIVLVVAAAAALLVPTLASVGPDPLGPEPGPFVLLAVLLAVGEAQPLRWYARTSSLDLTLTWSFAAALALLGPAGSALAALALASILGDVINRRRVSRVAFNAAQLVLSLGAGIAVLDLFGARHAVVGGEAVPSWWVLAAIAAGATILVTNGVLVSIVIALDQGVPFAPILRTSLLGNLSTDGMLLALAPAYILVADRSLPLLPLLLGSALAVHTTTALAAQRQHEAAHDLLTGLANRRSFEARLGEVLEGAAAGPRRAAVLLCDLDRFKEFNDRLGHRVGDDVLREAARRLVGLTRESDMVARFGGDEFAVVAYPIDGADDALAYAERIGEALNAPVDIDGSSVAMAASVGVALAPDHGVDATELMEHADLAMYSAKRQRRRSALYTRQAVSSPGRIEVLRDLPAALARGELRLRYQPIVALADRRTSGVEALVRWHHPRFGVVEPMRFMPLVEHTELIASLTGKVLQMALAAAARWRALGHDLVVSVNVSSRNLDDFEFPNVVIRRLAAAGLPPSALEIEVTENAVMRDRERAQAVMGALHDLGVRLAIDDFGTGFSSLVHLRHLPIDRLKIDRVFVAELASPHGAAIVGPLCTLARNLGLDSVAEGVEDPLILDELARLGCDHAQGFAIAEPLEERSMTAWLERTRSPV